MLTELPVEYANIKSGPALTLPTFFIVQGDDSIVVFVAGDEALLVSRIESVEDKAHFDTFVRPRARAVGSAGDATVLGMEQNGIPLVRPLAADGKPFTLPNIFPGECILNFVGRGDSPSGRYAGDLFGMQIPGGAADQHMDFGFADGLYLAGGAISWDGGSFGSWVRMTLRAPATTVVDPPVPGTGNCNLMQLPYGFCLIVPAPGNGQKNLGSGITPVPANDEETDARNGYWDYSDPWVGKGTISPSTPGAGKYNLFTADLEIGHFTDLHLLTASGVREVSAANIKPKWILPEWLFRVEVHNADAAKLLQVAWDLVIARRKSV